MDVDKAIQTRKSVRRFSDKKPDFRDIIEAIDAARYAPMAGNNYSVRFILVEDPKKIKRLADAAQQDFFEDVHYVVVVCTDVDQTENAYEERGKRYLRQQAGAAIQNFLLKINERKLSTCWIGHFVDYLVQETLGIPEKVQVEAMFPIGYEKTRPTEHERRKIPLNNIIFFDKYKNRFMGKKEMDA